MALRFYSIALLTFTELFNTFCPIFFSFILPNSITLGATFFIVLTNSIIFHLASLFFTLTNIGLLFYFFGKLGYFCLSLSSSTVLSELPDSVYNLNLWPSLLTPSVGTALLCRKEECPCGFPLFET